MITIQRAPALKGWWIAEVNGIEVYRDNAKWKVQQWVDLHKSMVPV